MLATSRHTPTSHTLQAQVAPLCWEKNLPLSEHITSTPIDPELAERFWLDLELLRQPDREQILDALKSPQYSRRLVDTLFRTRSKCSDFLEDRVAQATRGYPLNSDRVLSSDEIARLNREEIFLRAVMIKIASHGHVPNWIDLTKKIIHEAALPIDFYHHFYNAVRAISLIPDSARVTSQLFLNNSVPTALDNILAQCSFEPVLCFTEQNRVPGRLFDWIFKTFSEAQSPSGMKSYWIWMDAPFGLLLMRNQEPQAIMSFSINPQDKSLVVEQIQGISAVACNDNGEGLEHRDHRTFSANLFGINHRQLFLEIAELTAIQCEMQKVVVIGGANNIWIKPNKWKSQPTFTLAAATRNYDDTASARGYSKRDDGNWELKLR